MPCAAADRHTHGPRAQRGPAHRLRLLTAALLVVVAVWWPATAPAQSSPSAPPVEVVALAATRTADAVLLDYQLRVALPSPVEEAARNW
jgi:hypothetical protein